jgi:site-specific DNA-adenine methylase
VTYTLVEPCAGSAALTLHLLGAKRSIVPYQGNKWRFRQALAECAAELGFVGPPSRVVLTDPGPWGRALPVILDRSRLPGLIERLEGMASRDPAGVYRELKGAPVPADDVAFAAEFLFAQQLAFRGRAVGVRGGVWRMIGFDSHNARFGVVKGMVRRLRDLKPSAADLVINQEPAAHPAGRVRDLLVYLDPPYAGSAGYPNGGMDRREVERLAVAWRMTGAAVIVSEKSALDLPGWRRSRLQQAGAAGGSPVKSKDEEWITFAPGEGSRRDARRPSPRQLELFAAYG